MRDLMGAADLREQFGQLPRGQPFATQRRGDRGVGVPGGRVRGELQRRRVPASVGGDERLRRQRRPVERLDRRGERRAAVLRQRPQQTDACVQAVLVDRFGYDLGRRPRRCNGVVPRVTRSAARRRDRDGQPQRHGQRRSQPQRVHGGLPGADQIDGEPIRRPHVSFGDLFNAFDFDASDASVFDAFRHFDSRRLGRSGSRGDHAAERSAAGERSASRTVRDRGEPAAAAGARRCRESNA